MRQSISCFSNPVSKSYFRYTSTYLRRIFCVLLPLCSQKYRTDNILPIPPLIIGCNIALSIICHHSIPRYLLEGFHFRVCSIRCHSTFLLAFVFFSVLVLISHSYKVWCKYTCQFISNMVKYNCNTVKVR